MANEEVVDDFDKLFDEALADVDAKPKPDTVAAEPADKDEPADKKTADDKAEVEADKKVADEAALKPEPTEEETTAQAEADKKAADEVAAKAASDARIREEAQLRVHVETEIKARLAADAAAKKDAADKAAAAAAEKAKATTVYEYTAEEKEADEAFKRAFPDEYKATQAMIKRMRSEVEAEVYKKQEAVVQQINGVVDPLRKNAEESAALEHARAIRTAHSDFDTVIEKFPDWIKKQPAYLQPGLAVVYDRGTTEQVISLVADMKKSLGVTQEPVVEKKDPPVVDKKAAASLAPVSSARATPSLKGAPDKDDFDGAWEEAAGQK